MKKITITFLYLDSFYICIFLFSKLIITLFKTQKKCGCKYLLLLNLKDISIYILDEKVRTNGGTSYNDKFSKIEKCKSKMSQTILVFL